MSHPERPEDSSETPPPRIPLRPAENSGSLRPGEASGSLPPPLRIQPLSRPGAPPPPPVPGAPGPAQKIELQQLELKGQSRPVSPGVPIPPRPVVPRNPEEPPQDLSGVVPRGWPPPRVPLGEESEPTSELEPKPKAEQAPRFLPAPEVPASPLAARGRAAEAQHPRVPLGPPPELDDDIQRGGVASDAKASWAEGGETVPIHSGGNKSRKKPAMSKKGPIILVTAFAAVLLALLAMPILQKKPALSASASPTVADPIPVALPSETPEVASSPSPLVTPKPELVVVETPKPVAVVTPKPEPVVVETPKPEPVVKETPKPVVVETPKPSPTVAFKPPVRPEPPPAKDPGKSSYSVRVYLTPVGVDSKVYLVDQDDRNHRYSDEGAGNLHVQPKKKGSYTLKVVAPGYETFTKDIKVEGDHNLAVRLEKIPPPPPAYVPPAPGPAPYTPQYSPPPQYYPPPRPAPAPYQIPAPGI